MTDLLAIAAILIAQLGADRHAVREAASAALERPTFSHLLPLFDIAARSPDPEVAFRARRVADIHRGTWADGWLDRQGLLPWLDSMPRDFSDWDEFVQRYLAEARMTTAEGGHNGPEWPVYRHATRLWLRTQLVAGVGPERLLPVLAVMRARCQRWSEGKGYDGFQEP